MDNQMVWSVDNLVRIVPDGVVTTVCCKVSMTDGAYKAHINIYQKVPYKSPSDPSFIPFDQLTEAETIEWVQSKTSPERMNQIEQGLKQNIATQKVKTAQGVPW
jgi:hypothetical protein